MLDKTCQIKKLNAKPVQDQKAYKKSLFETEQAFRRDDLQGKMKEIRDEDIRIKGLSLSEVFKNQNEQ